MQAFCEAADGIRTTTFCMASSADGHDVSRRVGTRSAANPHPERDSAEPNPIAKPNAERRRHGRLGQDWAEPGGCWTGAAAARVGGLAEEELC